MVNQTFKPIILVLTIFSGLIIAQEKEKRKIDPVIQSVLLPGWGQKTLQYPKRAHFFSYVETGLLLTILGTKTYSNVLKKNYIAFASEHSAVISSGKDHKYWVDIGNFNTVKEYNDEHLRNREVDDLYPENTFWSWEWDVDSNRRSFENKRILSDQMKLAATFGLGATVLNHMVSAIDALYLKRLTKGKKLSVQPWLQIDPGSVGYAFTLNF